MQNKPNLVRRRRIANVFITMNYKNFIPLAGLKNKPNSNPISSKAKMNLKSLAGKSGHTRLIADVKKACKMQGHEDNGGNPDLSGNNVWSQG